MRIHHSGFWYIILRLTALIAIIVRFSYKPQSPNTARVVTFTIYRIIRYFFVAPRKFVQSFCCRFPVFLVWAAYYGFLCCHIANYFWLLYLLFSVFHSSNTWISFLGETDILQTYTQIRIYLLAACEMPYYPLPACNFAPCVCAYVLRNKPLRFDL